MNQYAIQRGAGPWLILAPGVVPELLLAPRVTQVANAVAQIHGLVNLRGLPVLILDPAPVLTMAAVDKRRVLVLDRDRDAVGVLIVGEPRLISQWQEHATSPAESTAPPALAKYLGRCGHSEAGETAEFDHRGFLRSLAGLRS